MKRKVLIDPIYSKNDKTASPAVLDGYIRLTYAVCSRAVKDLLGKDKKKALDALIWMIDKESSAPLFFDVTMHKHPRMLLTHINYEGAPQLVKRVLLFLSRARKNQVDRYCDRVLKVLRRQKDKASEATP